MWDENTRNFGQAFMLRPRERAREETWTAAAVVAVIVVAI